MLVPRVLAAEPAKREPRSALTGVQAGQVTCVCDLPILEQEQSCICQTDGKSDGPGLLKDQAVWRGAPPAVCPSVSPPDSFTLNGTPLPAQ